MSRSLNLIAACLLPLPVFCQLKEASSFGKIDKADLQLTSCTFNPEADAEVLSDVGEFTFEFVNGYVNQTLHKHVRIKIFNDKSLILCIK